MRIEVLTHSEILEDPIVEIDKTIDNPKNLTFTPCIVLIDSNDQKRRFAQYLPEQPYVNGSWTDQDVQQSVENYLKTIEIK